MTKEELAARLDGREYGSEITHEERDLARENGLVVVFGASDDLIEFRGAIYDEADCYNSGTTFLNESGLWKSKCHEQDCPHAAKERVACKAIFAHWHDGGGPCWTYETHIPHATFNIYKDGELWCIGIVFEMDALREQGGRQIA